MSKADRGELRDLRTREFFGFGPAFSVAGVFRMRTDDVATTMPKAGHRFEAAVPPPSAKVKKLLAAELANLPQEAHEEAETIEALKRENARLKREVSAKPVPAAAACNHVVEISDLKAKLHRAAGECEFFRKVAAQSSQKIRQELDVLLNNAPADLTIKISHKAAAAPPPRREMPVMTRAVAAPRASSGNGSLSGSEQKILNELAEMELIGVTPIDKAQLALLAGYTNPRSGGFSEPIGRLAAAGLVRYPRGGQVEITDAGRAHAVTTGGPRTTEELQERLFAKLDGPRQRILRALVDIFPKSIEKEALGQQLGYSNPRSGGFSEPLGALRALGLIDYPDRGKVAAQPVLFLEERR
jgi:hypothetical protein